MRAERDKFSVSCLMANTGNNYFGTTICKSCNVDCNVCSCKAPELSLSPHTDNKTEESSKAFNIFPPVPSDISTRPDIKQMDIFTNLEAVCDLEFHHEYISDQIKNWQ